jgi:hypothetical protein
MLGEDLAPLSYHGTRTQQLARHRFNVRTSEIVILN